MTDLKKYLKEKNKDIEKLPFEKIWEFPYLHLPRGDMSLKIELLKNTVSGDIVINLRRRNTKFR